jgi:hypothetical protein
MSLGPGKKRRSLSSNVVLAKLRGIDARVRLRLAIAAGGVLLAIATLATCGGCGKRLPAPADTTSAGSGAEDAGGIGHALLAVDAASLRDLRMWDHAKDGDLEDLATLAAHEGAMGLVEATSDPALRPTAIKAMGHARGWAQLPFLAKTAGGNDDEEARLALDAAIELAVRPRTTEDPEDAPELRDGCDALVALARDTTRPRPRRISAIRSLRMMPCPPLKEGEELPSDVDTK